MNIVVALLWGSPSVILWAWPSFCGRDHCSLSEAVFLWAWHLFFWALSMAVVLYQVQGWWRASYWITGDWDEEVVNNIDVKGSDSEGLCLCGNFHFISSWFISKPQSLYHLTFISCIASSINTLNNHVTVHNFNALPDLFQATDSNCHSFFHTHYIHY